ncbi:hypothetical protein T08_10637 [Trichinella sp. T8]|nr:hypothetical protein T08_10637 [Trichinella sp. T8]
MKLSKATAQPTTATISTAQTTGLLRLEANRRSIAFCCTFVEKPNSIVSFQIEPHASDQHRVIKNLNICCFRVRVRLAISLLLSCEQNLAKNLRKNRNQIK